MRKTLTILAAMVAMGLSAAAQNNTDRIGAGIGASYRNACDAVLLWEHENAYHNAWEVFVEGQLQLHELSQLSQLWDNGKRWGAGVAWKPCLWRARNRYGSARIGVSLGASPTDFQSSIQAGWQQSYALRGGWQFYWQAGADLMLPKWDGLFSIGGSVGIKMPVRDRLRRRLN
jgi:hypothetical protein